MCGRGQVGQGLRACQGLACHQPGGGGRCYREAVRYITRYTDEKVMGALGPCWVSQSPSLLSRSVGLGCQLNKAKWLIGY